MQVPLGTGIAFAHKYKDDGRVCVSLYGDGASNQVCATCYLYEVFVYHAIPHQNLYLWNLLLGLRGN